mmetsp:Transcript_11768/g.31666  ORF Transcript_11768/g.31666 Transcript_11768/m.31666 type:complete len:274 (+) Transcript_11768:1612-2433(+)
MMRLASDLSFGRILNSSELTFVLTVSSDIPSSPKLSIPVTFLTSLSVSDKVLTPSIPPSPSPSTSPATSHLPLSLVSPPFLLAILCVLSPFPPFPPPLTDDDASLTQNRESRMAMMHMQNRTKLSPIADTMMLHATLSGSWVLLGRRAAEVKANTCSTEMGAMMMILGRRAGRRRARKRRDSTLVDSIVSDLFSVWRREGRVPPSTAPLPSFFATPLCAGTNAAAPACRVCGGGRVSCLSLALAFTVADMEGLEGSTLTSTPPPLPLCVCAVT